MCASYRISPMQNLAAEMLLSFCPDTEQELVEKFGSGRIRGSGN